jgi:phosphatidylinositol 3-kinase
LSEEVALTSSPISEVYASVQLWANSKPLTAPVRTSYKSFKKDRA